MLSPPRPLARDTWEVSIGLCGPQRRPGLHSRWAQGLRQKSAEGAIAVSDEQAGVISRG